MIPLTSLLVFAPGIRVGVLGEGQLRFAAGRQVFFAASATLASNATGLLADAAGRPVLPQIKVGIAPFRVAMNGTVSVAGKAMGRLVLQRTGGDIGFPGEGTFGVLEIANCPVAASPSRPPAGTSDPRSAVRDTRSLTILVQGSENVAGDRVLLRDVAKLDGAPAAVARLGEIDLGATPVIGIHRTLTAWGVRAALRGTEFAAIEPRVLPDAMVARKSQTIDPSAIVAEARRELRRIAGTEDARYDMGPAALKTGCGEITFLTMAGKDANDRLPVEVAILLDGKEVGRRTINFFVHLDGVKAGDAVRLKLSRNGALLETDAKARSAGHMGETVQIVTAEGATLTATVTGAGAVEVRL